MAIGASIASLGIGLAQSGINFAEASKTRAQIENFKEQELLNPFKDITISTLKSEQQTEANLQNVSTIVEALRKTGARALASTLPEINATSILLQSSISSDLDRQDKERQLLIARGEERITLIREARERSALEGLGQQLQSQRQDAFSGLNNVISSLGALGIAIEGNKDENQFDASAFANILKQSQGQSTAIFIPTSNINSFN